MLRQLDTHASSLDQSNLLGAKTKGGGFILLKNQD